MEMLVVWLKALHIAAMLVWSAGLFYLPGLFALHPRTRGKYPMLRLRAMSRFVYVAIVSPAAVVAIVTGTALVYVTGRHGGWLAAKLTVVTFMALFHILLGWLLPKLHKRPALLAPRAHLAMLVLPAILVPTVFWLVLGKPL